MLAEIIDNQNPLIRVMKNTCDPKVENMQIRNIKAEAGTKSSGLIEIADISASTLKLPVGIIRGSEPGPTLCLIAGVHAVEYNGIVAAIRTYVDTDPKKIKGNIIVVPLVNVPSFQTKTPFVCVIDGKNIGRVFPGDDKGTVSERIAYTLFNEIILKSDYLVSMHCGDLPEDLVYTTIYGKTGNEEIDKRSFEIASAFPTKYVIGYDFKEVTSGSSMISSKHGVPSVISEAGGAGKLEQHAVEFHLKGITNIMKLLGMMKGDVHKTSGQRVTNKVITLKTNNGGIYVSKVKAGEIVSKGQVLGEVWNLFGEVVEKIVSPTNGFIWYYNSMPPTNPGEAVVRIGELNAHAQDG